MPYHKRSEQVDNVELSCAWQGNPACEEGNALNIQDEWHHHSLLLTARLRNVYWTYSVDPAH
jgi:hypothetical protein